MPVVGPGRIHRNFAKEVDFISALSFIQMDGVSSVEEL